MGHSRAIKREHHEEIVAVPASRFREDGVDRVGVANLMHDAGLTHGGFYRHFESRDQLVAEAVERALHDGGKAMAAVAESPHDPLAAVVERTTDLDYALHQRVIGDRNARPDPRDEIAFGDQYSRPATQLKQNCQCLWS
jgi:AcrR family transcriptional regulator